MLLPTVASLAVVPHAAALAVAVASLAELLESMPAAQLGIMDASRLFYTANHSEAAASSSTAQQQSSHKQRCPTTGTRRRRASRRGDGAFLAARKGKGSGMVKGSPRIRFLRLKGEEEGQRWGFDGE